MILLGSASRRCRRGRPGARPMGMSPLTIFGASTELWLRSDRGIVTVSGAVSQWRDQSGKGRHFSQATADSRPTYNASDSNWGGLPSLTFDGVDDKVLSDDAASVWKFLTDGSGGGAIVVYRGDSASSTDTFGCLFGSNVFTTNVAFGMFQLNSGTVSNQISNGTVKIISQGTTADEDVNRWLGFWYEEGRAGNEYEVNVSGTTAETGDSAAAPSASNPSSTIAVGDDPASSGISFAGEILEALAFSVYPSAAQLSAISTYMSARYGL